MWTNFNPLNCYLKAKTPEHRNIETPEHQNTRTPEHRNIRMADWQKNNIPTMRLQLQGVSENE
jgi:hypothetical protein